jgi:hypothetical protein
MNRAQRRRHHAKQRARKQRYRAWEAEHAQILDELGLSRTRRKRLYRLLRIAEPIVQRCFEVELIRNRYYEEVLDVRVSTAGAEALPRLAELAGYQEEDA